MRRLCMVVHGPYPIGEPRVAREARAAVDAGWEVDVVSMRRDGEEPVAVVDGVRVLRLPLAHRRGLGVVALAWEYVAFTVLATLKVAGLMLRRRYDVVQVHNPPDFLIVAGLVPKLLGARLLFDVHDLAPDMLAMRFEGRRWAGAAERVLRLIERAACALADAVVTVHEPYREELIARGGREERTHVVMNSVDERVLPAPRARDADAFRIVYHGTVTPHYGVELLVDALARIARDVPTARLEVYGEGDATVRVAARAAELGLADRVHVSGRYLPHAEALAAVNGAAVGVVPNLPIRLNAFALSTKLFEYCALGIPVVSSALPTLRAHFGDNEVRFFAPGDAGSLAEALLDVARDPAAAEARSAAARERCRAYAWHANAARYVRLLEAGAPHAAPVSA